MTARSIAIFSLRPAVVPAFTVAPVLDAPLAFPLPAFAALEAEEPRLGVTGVFASPPVAVGAGVAVVAPVPAGGDGAAGALGGGD